MATEHEPLLRDLYAAFNARDVDAVLAHEAWSVRRHRRYGR